MGTMGTVLKMQFVALFCLVLLNMNTCNGVTPSLEPPRGNSLKLKSRTYEGKYVYQCKNGTWVPVSASAMLVNISDSKISLGNYSLEYSAAEPKLVGTWYLRNDDADAAESGSVTSIVAGNEIASMSGSDSGSIKQVIAEASFHKSFGAAYRVSYIQRLNTKGGLPPPNKSKYCSENSPVIVPFEAEFWFYTQDTIPPLAPATIAVPASDRAVVEGFFCQGIVDYSYDGSQWQRKNMHGKLYLVPGGDEVGSFHMSDKPDGHGGRFSLETYNPNGWQVVGKIISHPVKVEDDSISWSLFKITSSSGNVSLVGPFSYYTMVGTRGGVPPVSSNVTKKGASWAGVFSCQFWTYKPCSPPLC